MKTLKSLKGEIRRVDEATANKLIGITWQYCSKSEYKALRKNVPKEQTAPTNITENRNISDKKLRKQRKIAKAQKA